MKRDQYGEDYVPLTDEEEEEEELDDDL